MAIKACIFDAYGTLFDVAAAAREAAAEPGREAFAKVWQKVATDWRLKQLQYTWLRAVADAHTDFWEVTQNGLDWALEASGLDDPELRERLLALYWELSAYPEVPAMLAALKSAGYQTAILSNGSPDMLAGAVDFGWGRRVSRRCAVSRGCWRLQAACVGLPDGAGPVRLRCRRGSVRLVERLGRGGGGGLWLSLRLGQSRGRTDGPAALDARQGPERPDHHSRTSEGVLMPKFTSADGLQLALYRRGQGDAGPLPVWA